MENNRFGKCFVFQYFNKILIFKIEICFIFFEEKGKKSLHNLEFVLNLHSLSRNVSKKAGLWCNGNTTVFGAVFQGSSPCRPTESPQLRGFFYGIN